MICSETGNCHLKQIRQFFIRQRPCNINGGQKCIKQHWQLLYNHSYTTKNQISSNKVSN